MGSDNLLKVHYRNEMGNRAMLWIGFRSIPELRERLAAHRILEFQIEKAYYRSKTYETWDEFVKEYESYEP